MTSIVPTSTLITVEIGPTHEERIADLRRQADEAGVEYRKRAAERRRQAGADAAFLRDDPSMDPALVRISDELRVLTSPGQGLCRDHLHRSMPDWLGIDRNHACCHQGLAEGIRAGRLILTNPEVLDDYAGDESREKIYRIQANYIRNAVRERVDEIAARLIVELETVAAAGGEPARRLGEALRSVLSQSEDARLRLVGSLGA